MRTFRSAVFLLLATTTLSALAQQKRPMTFADLQAMKRISDPQISPNGKWVMFSVTDVSLEKNTKTNHLWLVPMAGGAEHQLTTGSGEGEARFSPDGKWVAYIADDNGSSQIFLASWSDVDGTMSQGRPLTHISTEADGPIWSPDSQRLLFTSRVYPECSDSTNEEACDKAKDDAAAKSPVKAQIWDHLLYRHWTQYIGEKRSHVLVVSAKNGNDVRDLTPKSTIGEAEAPVFSLGGPLGYAWAPDSREIAYVTNLDAVPAASTNNDVFTLRLDQPGAKAVKISTSLGSDDAPAYSPDGKYLAFRSQKRAGFESDQFRLILYDRTRHSIIDLMPKFDGWIDELSWALYETLVFSSSYQGEERLYQVSAHEGETFGQATLIAQDGEYSSAFPVPSPLSGAPKAAFGDIKPSFIAAKMRVEMPTELVAIWRQDSGISLKGNDGVFEAASTREQQLTHLNDELLHEIDLHRIESFWFNAIDGSKIQGFIVRPPNFDPNKKYPLKFVMHGGPQTAEGDAWSYRWNLELLAANGYVVVTINRRGSTGYGQKFIDEVSGDWGGKAYGDLMTGLDFAEKKYPFIDKQRECALGASYGGFMANWVLTHTNRFQCIVTHDGLYDPVAAYGATEELWFNEWEFRPRVETKNSIGETGMVEEKTVGAPWDYVDAAPDADPFRKFSPMRFIKNAKTPTLVIHSQLDYRLDVSQGFALFTALQRLNVPSKMLYFPDEGHWVLKPQNSQLWYQTVNDWCDQWTRSGKYAGTPATTTTQKAAR